MKKLGWLIAILLILSVVGHFVIAKDYDNKPGWQHKDGMIELESGFHTLGKWPFITHVSSDELGVLIEYDNHYDVRHYKQVKIPEGYVGVLTQKWDGVVKKKPMYPGLYKINLDLYKVTLVDTQNREFVYSD